MKINAILLISFVIVFLNLSTITIADKIEVCSVGCQYNSIQYAIDNAKDGDEVYVKNGTYKEHLVLDQKSITLSGENRNTVIIDGSGSGECINLRHANANISEMTIRNCNGIQISGSTAIISRNIISGILGDCEEGGASHSGIYIGIGSSKIYDNLIYGNRHGIFNHRGDSVIYNNIITYNCHGIALDNAIKSEIYNNTITSNWFNAIQIDTSKNIILSGNNITKNKKTGIYVLSSTINATYNNLIDNSNGIYLQDSEFSQINNNTFISNAIYLKTGRKNIIEYNRFLKNTVDIHLDQSLYNTVRYNDACNIESTESNNIENNKCQGEIPEPLKQTDEDKQEEIAGVTNNNPVDEKTDITQSILIFVIILILVAIYLKHCKKNKRIAKSLDYKEVGNYKTQLTEYRNKRDIEQKVRDEEQGLAKIKQIIEKYLSTCDYNKKLEIRDMFSDDNEIFLKFKKHDIDDAVSILTHHLYEFEYELKKSQNTDDLEYNMKRKKDYEDRISLLEEFEKLFKLLKKKHIETDYLELGKILHDSNEITFIEENESIAQNEYERISKILKGELSVDNVITEYLKFDVRYAIPEKDDIFIISSLLNRFNLYYDKEALDAIVEKMAKDIEEDVEVTEFERNLGKKENNRIVISDYEHLNGHQFEAYMKNVFEALGYNATQTSLSGDQGADLFMVKDGTKFVVQTKKYNGKVSNKAIQEVVAAKNHYKADKALVVTNSTFTKSAVQLALSNGVELWDGIKLKKIINELNSQKD